MVENLGLIPLKAIILNMIIFNISCSTLQRRRGKQILTSNKLQKKQNLLGSIIHVSHNIILKIAPWHPGHYDVIDEIQNGGFRDILVVLFHE